MQVIAEGLLSDSQCGFRRGHGCVDMIFVARQLMEKTREHEDSLFMTFTGLKKAYDSVPRNALWSVLVKCGAPPMMLNIIKSFHEGMEAFTLMQWCLCGVSGVVRSVSLCCTSLVES